MNTSPEHSDSPKISVIVPVYKVEKYLSECIESVLAQTFTDFELILVDDGSPDNSGKICDEYAKKDSRIRVFHKENGGVSSARNLGLDNARGEWIAFVDSDDTVGNKYLEHLWGDLGATYKKSVLIVSGLVYRNEKNKELMKFSFLAGENFVKEAFRKECLYKCGFPVSKLYNYNVLNLNGIRFDEDISMAEDMLFMVDYLKVVEKVVFRSDYLDYNYWSRHSSLSKKHSLYEKELKFFLKFQQIFEDLGIENLNNEESHVYINWVFRLIYACYRPSFMKRSIRIKKLNKCFNILKYNPSSDIKLSIVRSLFFKKQFVIVDLIYYILFKVRYGFMAPAWNLYLKLKTSFMVR